MYGGHISRVQQGDQTCFGENSPIFSPIHFYKKIMRDLNRVKKYPKMWATSVMKKNLSKVKNGPMGENSPNLVNLELRHEAKCPEKR
jgi:hypothetical protein